LARTFDRIVGLLTERGYIADGEITAEGRRLTRIYTESDLLVAECLRDGAWKGLAPAELAAVASAVVYESRRESGFLMVSGPTDSVRNAIGRTVRLWSELRSDEARHKLPLTREPDLGFVEAVWKWARGEALVEALLAGGDQGNSLPAGDFVRWCRQVIDLLDQLHSTAEDPEIAATAAKAVRAIRRGVVAVDAA
jgi:ATP-dependent RNA helicase HelY